MTSRPATTPRSFWVPEVMQTSLMDCGPAALKAVLQGFGILVHYDLLRARCETDVDGTSIDALAALGHELGLESQPVLVSRDSLLLPEADCLPAIVVTRSGGGLLHFILVWNCVGPFVQIIDPSSGRRWLRKQRLLELLPDLPLPMSVERFRRWTGSENALAPLRARLRRVGMRPSAANGLIERAAAEGSWRGFAGLDAAVRMVTALIERAAIPRGRHATRLLESATERAGEAPAQLQDPAIPKRFFWVTPGAAPDKLSLHGAVVVRFSARPPAPSSTGPESDRSESRSPSRATAVRRDPSVGANHAARARTDHDSSETPLPESLQRDLDAPTIEPLKLLLRSVWFDSPRTLWIAAAALLFASVLLGVETVLLRAMLEVGRYLSLDYQRAAGLFTLLSLAALGLGLEALLARATRKMGSALELRLRAAFLDKLPRLEDQYLKSRSTADITARGCAMHLLRELPALGLQAGRAVLGLLCATAVLLWFYPEGAGWAISALGVALIIPSSLRQSMSESSMRLRTHASALERFYLDALLGVTPIRVHAAERAVRREHEDLLMEWARTAKTMHVQSTGVQALQLLATTGTAVGVVVHYVAHGGAASGLLLVAYCALRVPAAGRELALVLFLYRNLRSVALRLFAPLGAEESEAARCSEGPAQGDPVAGAAPPGPGVHIALRDVSCRVGGQLVLDRLSIEIAAGSHVAIVGASGAGKSSLLGLVLGWQRATEGQLLIDGDALEGQVLARLRETCAWVDPAVRLWDRSLYENLEFGASAVERDGLPEAIACADLIDVLEQLPEGMQAELGEGGARVSGGQGQRVRLGRALVRGTARVALLDEPFRGLPRESRRALLRRVRAHFRAATVLFVSHDISDTHELDRVLVLDAGRIVEDGTPDSLLADPASRYRALHEADRLQRARAWSGTRFRRWSLEGSRLQDVELR